jgi:tetratricopeptide (TPR) repeat protein
VLPATLILALLLGAAQQAALDCERALRLTPARGIEIVLAELNAAIAANPANACARNNRARIHVFRGETDQAIADYDVAIRLDPTLAFAFKNRGDLWLARDALDRAILDYSAAIRIDAAYASAYARRGLAYYRQRDYAAAIADYSADIRLGGASYAARGDAYRDSGQLERALKDYTVVIQGSPRNTAGWRGRASLRMLSGDLEGAVADYDKAIFYGALDPSTYALSWAERGRAKLALGDRDGAIADLRKALALKPDLESARAALHALGIH